MCEEHTAAAGRPSFSAPCAGLPALVFLARALCALAGAALLAALPLAGRACSRLRRLRGGLARALCALARCVWTTCLGSPCSLLRDRMFAYTRYLDVLRVGTELG